MLKKRISCILALVLCLVMVLGACGTTEEQPAATETQAAAAETQAAAVETEAAETEAASPIDWEDTAEIEVYYFAFSAPQDSEHVEEAINEITVPAINTKINFNVLDISSYMQQMGVMMAGGEQIDLMLSAFGAVTYAAMTAQNQLMDIADLLDVYGQDILATVGDLIEATSVGDAIYAVPTYRNLLSSYFIFMRKDVLEDLGLLEKARNMTSFAEYEEILAAVEESEKWSTLTPYAYYNGSGTTMLGFNGYGDFATSDVYDQLGDTLGIIYCGEDGKVQFAWETESFVESIKMNQNWYNNGWTYSDAAGNASSATDYVKSNVAFSYISTSEFGAETAHSSTAGMDLVAVEMKSGFISAASCTKFTWCVPNVAQEPEAAIAFLNFAITSPEINTLMAWGVEGVDYVVVDGVGQYPEGQDGASYHLFDYSVPNQFLVLPWSGDTADMRERSLENMQSGTISPYLGFSCDTTEFSAELSAVTNVYNEYKSQVEKGSVGMDVYEEAIEKFYASGLQVILDGYQAQLDAYLAQ